MDRVAKSPDRLKNLCPPRDKSSPVARLKPCGYADAKQWTLSPAQSIPAEKRFQELGPIERQHCAVPPSTATPDYKSTVMSGVISPLL
ncbi:hypothetical protein NDU88_006286 [Pleurodeles waltl]|uniref:Uncharacterized protein n=1 Tax=Pleurodeles waltl TaxID=8319 RepID=A0AAV7MYS4_PLEWA|nr:hypothetical protein NDU88_006286 [Pleurodeles waltl]